MAGKRNATSELNHDNWNEEETPDEPGTFAKAPEDVLQKRVIKSARRRVANSGDAAPKSAFGSFAGFKTATATSTTTPFSFLANTNLPASTNTLSNTSTASNGPSKTPENGTKKTESSPVKPETTSMETEVKNKAATKKEDNKVFQKSSDYYAKLKGLNESVAQWIKTHVDSNPFCILTPIFRDYERYLNDIESKHGEELTKATDDQEKSLKMSGSESASKPSIQSSVKKPEDTIFGKPLATSSVANVAESKQEKSFFGNVSASKSVFGSSEQKTETKNLFGSVSGEKNPFLSKPFGTDEKKEEGSEKSDPKTTSSLSFSQNTGATFSFGQSSATSTASAGFSFGSAKPFSFGGVVKPQDSEEKKEEEKDEEEEPPKAEFKPVTEEGAIYEKRCKVFVKKDGNFTERGIGTLFLKPTPNDKTQLIVRADTSLGNLLMNTLLTESIPTQRMGKNNVMMVCLPTPDAKPPPTPILLRVKTSEDADALLEKLNKHKK